MKKYQEPKIEIVEIETADIITTSPTTAPEDDETSRV